MDNERQVFRYSSLIPLFISSTLTWVLELYQSKITIDRINLVLINL